MDGTFIQPGCWQVGAVPPAAPAFLLLPELGLSLETEVGQRGRGSRAPKMGSVAGTTRGTWAPS